MKKKVFISWSGDLSKDIAKAIKEWLPKFLPFSEPYLSSETEKGDIWFVRILKEISNSDVGIICLTKQSINSQWVLFESGVLYDFLNSKSHIYPLLIDIDKNDFKGPLAFFQYTQVIDKEDFKKLIKTINNIKGIFRINAQEIEKNFNEFWPSFESKIKEIFKKIEDTKLKSCNVNIRTTCTLSIKRGAISGECGKHGHKSAIAVPVNRICPWKNKLFIDTAVATVLRESFNNPTNDEIAEIQKLMKEKLSNAFAEYCRKSNIIDNTMRDDTELPPGIAIVFENEILPSGRKSNDRIIMVTAGGKKENPQAGKGRPQADLGCIFQALTGIKQCVENNLNIDYLSMCGIGTGFGGLDKQLGFHTLLVYVLNWLKQTENIFLSGLTITVKLEDEWKIIHQVLPLAFALVGIEENKIKWFSEE